MVFDQKSGSPEYFVAGLICAIGAPEALVGSNAQLVRRLFQEISDRREFPTEYFEILPSRCEMTKSLPKRATNQRPKEEDRG